MDFMFKLPPTTKRYDGIKVIINWLTKSTHFVPMREWFYPKKLGHLFVNHIISLHRVPMSITSSRDPCFTLTLWNILANALEAKLDFNTKLILPLTLTFWPLLSLVLTYNSQTKVASMFSNSLVNSFPFSYLKSYLQCFYYLYVHSKAYFLPNSQKALRLFLRL